MQKKYLYLTIALFSALVLYSAFSSTLSGLFSGLINGLIPIVFAFFLAYVLDHGVTFFEKVYFNIGVRKSPLKILSVISSILSLLLVIAGLFAIALPSVIENGMELSTNLPSYTEKISSLLSEVDNYLSLPENLSLKNLFDTVDVEAVNGAISAFLSSALNFIGTVSVSIILSVMILIEKSNIKKALGSFTERAFKSPEKIKTGFNCVKVVLDGYFWGKLLDGVITGALFTVLYYVTGIPYALILGILMSLLYMVPYVGGYIALVPAIFAGFTVSIPVALIIGIGGIVILNITGTFVSPIIFKNSINISALTTLSSIVIGGNIAGILGFLIAPPIAGLIKLFLSVFIKSKKDKSVQKN